MMIYNDNANIDKYLLINNKKRMFFEKIFEQATSKDSLPEIQNGFLRHY